MDETIDARVKRLVDVLNRLPGINTFSSCGGHNDHNDEEGQCPENVFYVHFSVDPGDGFSSMTSLGVITRVCESLTVHDDDITAAVTTFTMGDPASIAFQIDGENIEPDAIADVLDQISSEFVTCEIPPLPPMSKLN